MAVIRFVPRERDDQILGCIADRVAGGAAYRIAKDAGVNSGQVVESTNNVRVADEAYAVGENLTVADGKPISEAYW